MGSEAPKQERISCLASTRHGLTLELVLCFGNRSSACSAAAARLPTGSGNMATQSVLFCPPCRPDHQGGLKQANTITVRFTAAPASAPRQLSKAGGDKAAEGDAKVVPASLKRFRPHSSGSGFCGYDTPSPWRPDRQLRSRT